jgi:hypothetical protein
MINRPKTINVEAVHHARRSIATSPIFMLAFGQSMSAYSRPTDLARPFEGVRTALNECCLKSFRGGERKFFEPMMRLMRGGANNIGTFPTWRDVRNYGDSTKLIRRSPARFKDENEVTMKVKCTQLTHHALHEWNEIAMESYVHCTIFRNSSRPPAT